MNTVSNVPLPGLAPEVPLQPASTVTASDQGRVLHRLKDIVVTIYAYGLLLFGLLFPFVLAAWQAMSGSAAP